MLANAPRTLFERLLAANATDYESASRDRQPSLLDAAGCLHRLCGFLFHLSRVSHHAVETGGSEAEQGWPYFSQLVYEAE